MYVFENTGASMMIGYSSLYRMEIASGSNCFFNPEWWGELKALEFPWISALAVEQWRRMMTRMHQPIPFPMRVLIRLNSSFMNCSIGVKILSITESHLASSVAILTNFTFFLVFLFSFSEFFVLRDSFVGLLELLLGFTLGLIVRLLSTSPFFND